MRKQTQILNWVSSSRFVIAVQNNRSPTQRSAAYCAHPKQDPYLSLKRRCATTPIPSTDLIIGITLNLKFILLLFTKVLTSPNAVHHVANPKHVYHGNLLRRMQVV